MSKKRIVIIGGGAAGCFAAIHAAEAGGSHVEVTLLEGGRELLSKVRVSGGGRCNVTHSCFDPARLVQHYPRGHRELRGPFHQFQPLDMIAWLKERGVELKTEEDGRMFPVTDQSATIIDCLQQQMRKSGVRCLIGKRVVAIRPGSTGFEVEVQGGVIYQAEACMLAVGSLQRSPLLPVIEALGHSVAPLAPSLFAFNIQDKRIQGLAGVSVAEVELCIDGLSFRQKGPLLITHRGMSGPAVLKLSAWAARELAELDYRFRLRVNWLGGDQQMEKSWQAFRQTHPRKKVTNLSPGVIPARLWERLVLHVDELLPEARHFLRDTTWAHVSQEQMALLGKELLAGEFEVSGKSMNKEEFVTCGGVALPEIHFKTMESRIVPGLYFGGECLDIDGITGGFNFQAAWTAGYLAGSAMAG